MKTKIVDCPITVPEGDYCFFPEQDPKWKEEKSIQCPHFTFSTIPNGTKPPHIRGRCDIGGAMRPVKLAEECWAKPDACKNLTASVVKTL